MIRNIWCLIPWLTKLPVSDAVKFNMANINISASNSARNSSRFNSLTGCVRPWIWGSKIDFKDKIRRPKDAVACLPWWVVKNASIERFERFVNLIRSWGWNIVQFVGEKVDWTSVRNLYTIDEWTQQGKVRFEPKILAKRSFNSSRSVRNGTWYKFGWTWPNVS